MKLRLYGYAAFVQDADKPTQTQLHAGFVRAYSPAEAEGIALQYVRGFYPHPKRVVVQVVLSQYLTRGTLTSEVDLSE